MIRVDYHVHPNYSIDAKNYSIKEYCQRALQIGLQELCFTTHYETDPARRNIDWFIRLNNQLHPMDDFKWLDFYFYEIEKVKNEFKSYGLSVKAGLEVGYEPGQEKTIERLLINYPFDFVMGSVHCLEHYAISSKRECKLYYPGKSMHVILKEYFFKLSEGVKSGLFDCIGHLDLYRRYGVLFFGQEIEKAHQGYIEPLFELMSRSNIGLEINTSSIRRGLNEFHPSKRILIEAKKAGIKVFTIGSDAHNLKHLGNGVIQAAELLNNLNLKVSLFEQRQVVRQG